MILVIEAATNEILSQGAMVVVLAAGMYMMYKHFNMEVKELKTVIREKDLEIRELNKEVSELLRQSTHAHAEMSHAITTLTTFIKETWLKS
jgi:F0F1-type ATP synthase membrane subunit b/b'